MTTNRRGVRSMAIGMPASAVGLGTGLELNRHRLRLELVPKLRRYESVYGLPSDQLSAALASGQLADTDEICDWLIAWETLRAIAPVAGPSRVE